MLFTKWDRFSRNTGDAYQMIALLRKMGVEPQAIEQPLDMSVPENKMMLAFYLAAPEVENDRRSINITYGMRRAMKEGRHMGRAPMGYVNKITENGQKYIAICQPEAQILKWAFEEIANGVFNVEQIYNKAKEMGLNRTKSQFWLAIRSPVFCGKICIPKFKDEDAFFVRATHEPLISEVLYDQVQDVLDGRGRQYQAKIITDVKYPFRGILECNCCGKKLTASTSKGGRGALYSYYHCVDKSCRVRFKTEVIHQAFYKEVSQYIPKKQIKKLYAIVISEAYHKETKEVSLDRKEILREITGQESKLSTARELIATGKIDADDFRELKTKCLESIEKLERKLNQLATESGNIEELLENGIENLLNLENTNGDDFLYEFRRLISAIYPENFIYDGQRVRTPRVNTILHFIYLINNELDKNKKGQNNTKVDLSGKVENAGFEPATSCLPGKRSSQMS